MPEKSSPVQSSPVQSSPENDGAHPGKSSTIRTFLILSGLLWLFACSSNKTTDLQGARPTRLTAQATQILSFENPADWQGIHATNPDHTHGTVSGEVHVNGWTEIISVPMSTIVTGTEQVGDTLRLDVRVPQAIHWGTVGVIVRIPSAGIWWGDIGTVQLTTLPAGAFGTAVFSIPAHIRDAINGTYPDLNFIITLNGPSMSSPVLLDNLRFDGIDPLPDTDSPPDTDSENPDPNQTWFSVSLPGDVTLETVVVQAGESMRIADAVHAVGADANLVNIGDGLVELGADARIDGNVYAFGDVFLRERTRVEGQLKASGSVEQQNSVTVVGGVMPHASLNIAGEYGWPVNWPDSGQNHHMEPDTELVLEPGSYGALHVKSRASLTLSAGIYYFDSFATEPQARIQLNGGGDAVILYIRNSFTNRAQIEHSTNAEDFFVGFAGTGTVELDGPYAGTVVAPNATIRLAPLNGGVHEGSFFARRVEAEARTPINFIPFKHWDVILTRLEVEAILTSHNDSPFVFVVPQADGSTLTYTRAGDIYRMNSDGSSTLLHNNSSQTIGLSSIHIRPGYEGYAYNDNGMYTLRNTQGDFLGSQPSIRGVWLEPIPGGTDFMKLEITLPSGDPVPPGGFGHVETKITGSVVTASGEIVTAINETGMIVYRLISGGRIYSTSSHLIKDLFLSGEQWRVDVAAGKLEVSADGSSTILVVAHRAQTLHLYQESTLKGEHQLDSSIWNLAISTDGKHSAASTQRSVYLFEDGNLVRQFSVNEGWIVSIDVSDSGEVLVGGQNNDHSQFVVLLNARGHILWRGEIDSVDDNAWRPDVVFARDGQRALVRDKTGIKRFGIQRGGSL